MSEEEKLKIEQECLLKYSKAKMIEKYINTLEENQQLKEKINGVDEERTYLYNKLSIENEQLNILVNSCQEEIRQLKKQLEEYKATNKVLSKELTKDKVLQQDHLTTCCGIPIGDIPKLITQQKEFIKYMNDIIKELEAEDVNDVQKAIKELQQENKKLNGAIQTYDILLKTNVEENKQLKEVIEEVREYILNHELVEEKDHYVLNGSELLQILDKAKEN